VLKRNQPLLPPGGIARDLFSLGSVQALSALLPLATVPYLLRVIGLEAFGWYNLSLAVMNLGVAWVDFGFTVTGSREKAALGANKEKRREAEVATQQSPGPLSTDSLLYSRYLFTQLILLIGGVAAILLWVAAIPSWRAQAPVFLASTLLLPAQALMPAWWLQGSRQFTRLAQWQITGRLLFTLGVFSLVREGDGSLKVSLLNGGSALLVATAAMIQVVYANKLRIVWPGWATGIKMLRINLPMFLGGVSSALYTHSTLIVLELLAGARWVGMISALEKIVLVFRMAANSVQQVLVPRLAAMASQNSQQAAAFIRTIGTPVLLVGVAGSGLLWLFGTQILTLVIGLSQPEALPMLSVLGILPPLLALGCLTSGFLLGTRHIHSYGQSLMRAAAGGIGIHLSLIAFFGPWATIASLVGAELIIVTSHLWAIRRMPIWPKQPSLR